MENIKFVKLSEKTFLSGACRCCFPHVFEKHTFQDPEKADYSITLLVKKDDPILPELKATMKAVLMEKFNGKIPAGWHNPIMDGDDKSDKYPEMVGHYAMKIADKRNQPFVVDRAKAEILDRRAIYAGCWVRVKFDVYAFDKVTKGVNFGLRTVQKLADGEPFGNVTNASADDLPDLAPPEPKQAVTKPGTTFDDGEW